MRYNNLDASALVNEENEGKFFAPAVESTQNTFVTFAIFCAKTWQTRYELRGFRAFPDRSAPVGQTQSDRIKPNQTSCGGQTMSELVN